MKLTICILTVLLFIFSFDSHGVNYKKIDDNSPNNGIDSNVIFPYKLKEPYKKYQLPQILNEVSGLTDVDSTHIACVQDEIGTVFIYNFVIDSIVFSHKFDSIGDFEGLTYTGKSLFILRSDGQLTEWSNFDPKNGGTSIRQYMLPLITSNNEGLCFDGNSNRLLIAAKNKPNNPEQKSERFIYEFDLETRKLNPMPVYSINTLYMGAIAERYNIEHNDTTKSGKLRPFNFRPASLSINPITKDIYVISAADKLLVVMDINGTIKHMEKLSAELFAKAEGITFLADGTMIITNEAAGKSPTLLVYKLNGN